MKNLILALFAVLALADSAFARSYGCIPFNKWGGYIPGYDHEYDILLVDLFAPDDFHERPLKIIVAPSKDFIGDGSDRFYDFTPTDPNSTDVPMHNGSVSWKRGEIVTIENFRVGGSSKGAYSMTLSVTRGGLEIFRSDFQCGLTAVYVNEKYKKGYGRF